MLIAVPSCMGSCYNPFMDINTLDSVHLKLNRIRGYIGMKEGHHDYAYMKDGVFYVGSCGSTLKEAHARINKSIEEVRKEIIQSLEDPTP